MPHTDRRAEIVAAVERLLTRGGVSAVTMRAVASEAGVSLRLVQYYGKTKDELLSAALDHLSRQSVDRWRARSTPSTTGATAIDHVAAFFDEALPVDESSRGLHSVGVSLEHLAITDPDRGGQAYRVHLRGLADHLAGVLRGTADVPAPAARLLAMEVMSMAHGVGTLLMTGTLTPSEAADLIDDYLQRLRPRLDGGRPRSARRGEDDDRTGRDSTLTS